MLLTAFTVEPRSVTLCARSPARLAAACCADDDGVAAADDGVAVADDGVAAAEADRQSSRPQVDVLPTKGADLTGAEAGIGGEEERSPLRG